MAIVLEVSWVSLWSRSNPLGSPCKKISVWMLASVLDVFSSDLSLLLLSLPYSSFFICLTYLRISDRCFFNERFTAIAIFNFISNFSTRSYIWFYLHILTLYRFCRCWIFPRRLCSMDDSLPFALCHKCSWRRRLFAEENERLQPFTVHRYGSSSVWSRIWASTNNSIHSNAPK